MIFNQKINGSLCKCLCAISFGNFVRKKMKIKCCNMIILHIYLRCNSTYFNQGSRISTKTVHAKNTCFIQFIQMIIPLLSCVHFVLLSSYFFLSPSQ